MTRKTGRKKNLTVCSLEPRSTGRRTRNINSELNTGKGRRSVDKKSSKKKGTPPVIRSRRRIIDTSPIEKKKDIALGDGKNIEERKTERKQEGDANGSCIENPTDGGMEAGEMEPVTDSAAKDIAEEKNGISFKSDNDALKWWRENYVALKKAAEATDIAAATEAVRAAMNEQPEDTSKTVNSGNRDEHDMHIPLDSTDFQKLFMETAMKLFTAKAGATPVPSLRAPRTHNEAHAPILLSVRKKQTDKITNVDLTTSPQSNKSIARRESGDVSERGPPGWNGKRSLINEHRELTNDGMLHNQDPHMRG